MPAVMNLLLKRNPQDAFEMPLVWAQRSPRFSGEDFMQRWQHLQQKPIGGVGVAALQRLAEPDTGAG